MNQNMHHFKDARLKLEWADRHILQLQAAWKAYCDSDFCELVVEDHPDGGQILKIVSVKPLWADFALLLGDAVHNLRSSLDYAVNEILGWKDTRLTFPMSESFQELQDSFRTEPEVVEGRTKRKGRNAPVEIAVPGIAEFFLDEIKPYRGGGNSLWILNKLSQRDKHRLLLPTVCIHEITGINAVDKNRNVLRNCSARVGAGGTMNMVDFAGGITIESYGKPTASILINEPGIIDSTSLLPALFEMRQACHETIRSLDMYLNSINWCRPA